MNKIFKKVAQTKLSLDVLSKYYVNKWYVHTTDMEVFVKWKTTAKKWLYNNEELTEISEYPITEYVSLPKMDKPKETGSFSLTKKEFNQLLESVTERIFSPVLAWVFFSNEWCIVATDSFILTEVKWRSFKNNFIIPRKTFELIKYLDLSYIEYKLYENMVTFKSAWIELTSILIKWIFPDYKSEKIMPKIEHLKEYLDFSSVSKKAPKRSSVYFAKEWVIVDKDFHKWGEVYEFIEAPNLMNWWEFWFSNKYLRILWSWMFAKEKDNISPMIKYDWNTTTVVRPLILDKWDRERFNWLYKDFRKNA